MDCFNKHKGLKHTLKESIADVANKLGQGLGDPVPYDTAWVARIPQLDDTSLPAFPLSLQWLRNHQLDDGSWGNANHLSPHSCTLNTLAAIVALAEWNNPEDKTRIQRGVKALWDLVDQLPSEIHEGVGFELILPSLQRDARKYGLEIPHEHYKIYEQRASKKLNVILAEFRKYGYTKPATWWHNLEILGDDVQINLDGHDLGFSSSMLTKGGSIGASPSATAYLLRSQRLRGLDVPEAANYLKEIYLSLQGGMPENVPIDIFELTFSLDFFLKAGFSVETPMFKDAINSLAKYYKIEESASFSSHFKVPDSDDTALALAILLKAGYELSPEPVLKFFNGTRIVTYMNDTTSSVSVNINALNALKLFQQVKKVDEVIQQVLLWTDTNVSQEQIFLDDKWNILPYYTSSRAVFSLHGCRDDIVNRCLDFFLKSINKDGGWGKNGISTAEETAYVSLALTYAIKCGYAVPETILETASTFLSDSDKLSVSPLWVNKVLYRPTLIAESAVISARYALAKILEVSTVKSFLEEIQPYYIETIMKKIESKKSYHLSLLCLSEEFNIYKYSDQITRVRERIISRLLELDLIKKGEILLKMLFPECTLYNLRSDISDDDMILHAYLSMTVFIYDDILDRTWELFKSNTNVIKQAFQIFLEILQGKHDSVDTVTPIDFPKFISQCKLFLDIRCLLAKKESDLDEFLYRQERVFRYNIKDVNNRINGTALSSNDFLEIKKITFASYMFHTLNLIIKGVSSSSFKNYSVFHQFEDHALKASQLVADIFSFSRDIDKGWNYDNYVLVKQAERKCSLESALDSTIKLYNKHIIKMYSLKKVMQNDSAYKDNHELFKAVAIVENTVQSVIDWALETKRYQSKTTLSVSRNQLKKADFPILVNFFYNRARVINN